MTIADRWDSDVRRSQFIVAVQKRIDELVRAGKTGTVSAELAIRDGRIEQDSVQVKVISSGD